MKPQKDYISRTLDKYGDPIPLFEGLTISVFLFFLTAMLLVLIHLMVIGIAASMFPAWINGALTGMWVGMFVYYACDNLPHWRKWRLPSPAELLTKDSWKTWLDNVSLFACVFILRLIAVFGSVGIIGGGFALIYHITIKGVGV